MSFAFTTFLVIGLSIGLPITVILIVIVKKRLERERYEEAMTSK